MQGELVGLAERGGAGGMRLASSADACGDGDRVIGVLLVASTRK